MYRLLFIALSATFLLWQCQPASNEQTEEQGSTPTEATAAAEPQYPSLPRETLQMLIDSCDYIDYMFYHANFSMSQSQKPAILGTLSGISSQPPVIQACQADGRVFFQVDGENAVEADIFINNGCAYYIFLKDGRYTYANLMTQQGFGYYANIFKQIPTAPQGGQQ